MYSKSVCRFAVIPYPLGCIVIVAILITCSSLVASGNSTCSHSSCNEYIFIIAMPRIVATDIAPSPRIGESFFIECVVNGIPLPTVSWRKDGAPLEKGLDENLQIITIPGRNASQVEVTMSNVNNNGLYVCIARNDAGSVSKSFRIELQATSSSNYISIIITLLEHDPFLPKIQSTKDSCKINPK